MRRGKSIRKLIAFALLIALCLNNGMMGENTVSAKTDISLDQYKELLSKVKIEGMDYKAYLAQYDTTKRPDKEYIIEAKDYVRTEDMEVKEYTDYEGMEGTSVYTPEQGLIEYEINIEEEGFYDVSLLYYPVEGKSASIQRGIFIDGDLPYSC
ncbi:MAG TPA: hypothetical protein VN131_07160 [Mobilitalea sp.]|nr:hypothetical protein [Mobilitalea sp.]